jgi:hypothetical protein
LFGDRHFRVPALFHDSIAIVPGSLSCVLEWAVPRIIVPPGARKAGEENGEKVERGACKKRRGDGRNVRRFAQAAAGKGRNVRAFVAAVRKRGGVCGGSDGLGRIGCRKGPAKGVYLSIILMKIINKSQL